LNDESPEVRRSSAWALGEIGPPACDAAIALANVLVDPNEHVRQKAAEAIGRIGPSAEAAVPALIDMLKKEADTVESIFAMLALGKIGVAARAALPILQARLDMSEEVESLRWAISQIDPKVVDGAG
jgi:HEAT repeat protein